MYVKMRSLGLVVCLALVVTIAACARDRDERTNRTAGQVAEDNVIAAKVKSALIADPDVKGTQVGIEVFRGVVQLSGFVDSAASVQRAVSITRGISGVRDVRNSLIVR